MVAAKINTIKAHVPSEDEWLLGRIVSSPDERPAVGLDLREEGVFDSANCVTTTGSPVSLAATA